LLASWFPVPALLLPPTAGIDISDASVKWLVLERTAAGLRIASFGEMPLESGIVVSGVIQDGDALTAVLRRVRKELGSVSAAHSALPEEAAYVFSMTTPPQITRAQTMQMIEFEFEGRVPIPPSAAVFDFSHIPNDSRDEQNEISVAVFPREIAAAYRDAFERAGITLLSLEIEASSIARAVTSKSADEPITLLVDFGRARTGFAVIKRGVPIFTSTVELGGETIMRALTGELHMTPAEANHFKNEEGLTASKQRSNALAAISGTASALSDEVKRHYRYWDTRRNDQGERVTPVGNIILVGGSSNLKGLSEYIAGRVQAPVEIGHCWRHVANFEDYIPPIDFRTSIQFATAIGLALRTHL
jgi:type IV pilus assembly protein PilM